MDFYCNTKELSKACQVVIGAVATRAAVPALEGIKIDASESGVSLCGYDLEIGIKTKIDAEKLPSPGNAVLDAKMLCSIVKKLPDSDVEISTDEKGNAQIKCGAAEFSLPTIPTEEFPDIPEIKEDAKSITLSQPVLKRMIRQTLFAVSEDDAKPVHTGALFDVSNNGLTTVGVDGYRIAICNERIENLGIDSSFVVPGKTLSTISKMLSDDSDETTNITLDVRHVTFEIGNYIVFSRLLEGDFINYKAVIPKISKTSLKVDTMELLQSVQRVSLIINDRLKSPIVCDLSHDDGTINISCNTEIGKAKDSVSASINGDDVHIGFNRKYLEDALSNVDCDEIQMELNGSLSPMVILPDEGDSFLFLVLPVRLKNMGNGA